MAIISSYFQGESYGVLGPQMAASVIRRNSPCESIVIALPAGYKKTFLKRALSSYFGSQMPIVGFSNLSGREDLISLARELKKEGAITILAGPQAAVDYCGEKGRRNWRHRFKGFSDHFSFALQGPAEQIIPFLDDPVNIKWKALHGSAYLDRNGSLIRNPANDWDQCYLDHVEWENICILDRSGFVPLQITQGQVLQQIGCPWAAGRHRIGIDFPAAIPEMTGKKIHINSKGCSFCDVAVDKGFFGSLDLATVLRQIKGLPDGPDGRKIPFELINENPFPSLVSLIDACLSRSLGLSKIGLAVRVDALLKGARSFRSALQLARKHRMVIVLASVGFESFNNVILRNLNKGVTVSSNLKAVRLIRRLKKEFPFQLSYTRDEGGNHGFIHPTPWDSEETLARNQQVIGNYGLDVDILPYHSTPLIIHHDSALGDWIRAVEAETGLQYPRMNSWVEWWEPPAPS
ncbi:MAG: hypothetical protein QNI95_01530 [Desulfobacterales bacterium]|nr:hypothetical protein [Desulfobacterales bacterium]